METAALVSVTAAYFLGSIPFGVVVSRLYGLDITKVGSGNIGATNVARTLGKGPGFLVLFLDAAKGCAAVLIAKGLQVGPAWVVGAAGACLLGNLFSIFLRFRGGKGVATGIGILVGLDPRVFLLTGLAWLAVGVATGYVSLASLLSFALLPLFMFFVAREATYAAFGLFLALLVTIRHRENIGRLLAGKEPKTLRQLFSQKKEEGKAEAGDADLGGGPRAADGQGGKP